MFGGAEEEFWGRVWELCVWGWGGGDARGAGARWGRAAARPAGVAGGAGTAGEGQGGARGHPERKEVILQEEPGSSRGGGGEKEEEEERFGSARAGLRAGLLGPAAGAGARAGRGKGSAAAVGRPAAPAPARPGPMLLSRPDRWAGKEFEAFALLKLPVDSPQD